LLKDDALAFYEDLDNDDQDDFDKLTAALKRKFPAHNKAERKVAAMREYQSLS